jgi:hypothetical protein
MKFLTYTNISHTISKYIYDSVITYTFLALVVYYEESQTGQSTALLSIVVGNSQIKVSVLLGYDALPPDAWSLTFLHSFWSHIQWSKFPPVCFNGSGAISQNNGDVNYAAATV